MGNKQNRTAHISVDFLQQIQNLSLYSYVKGRRRFIRNDQIRMVDNRHGNHHTLTHTAGNFMRILIHQ